MPTPIWEPFSPAPLRPPLSALHLLNHLLLQLWIIIPRNPNIHKLGPLVDQPPILAEAHAPDILVPIGPCSRLAKRRHIHDDAGRAGVIGALDDVVDDDAERGEDCGQPREVLPEGRVGLRGVFERGRGQEGALAVGGAQGDDGVDVEGVVGCDEFVGCLALFGGHAGEGVWRGGCMLGDVLYVVAGWAG